jgi:acetyltransferase-like isoleucine patch superfamily enzyme
MSNPTDETTRDPLALDYNGWLFWQHATPEQQQAQLRRQEDLLRRARGAIGEKTFISELAMVEPTEFTLGSGSYVAAHAYITGTVNMGDDCTVNAFSVVRGTVTCGDGVRIGAHTSILGFNHSTAPDRRIYLQAGTEIGIRIGEDVWIGSNVVIVDGVRIGSHAVIGAGSVVTADVPDWAIVAGNPARFIRDRRAPRKAEQVGAIIARSWEPDALAADGTSPGRYVDAPGAHATLRAHADAVELSMLLTAEPPQQLTREQHIARLRENQDPITGLTPLLIDQRHAAAPSGFDDGSAHYHVLSLGYALDLLGSRFEHPITAVEQYDLDEIIAFLEGQPWKTMGWAAGAGVDTLGTALLWNLRTGDPETARHQANAMFGWLLTNARRDTGMWTAPRLSDGMLEVVNGYYRAIRGSFAQYGLPVPYPERVIDAVLDHARDERHFGPGRTTACNALDIAHPLWIAAKQTSHRAAEVTALAQQMATETIARWQPREGFAFRVAPLGGPKTHEHRPGLQGTEMWAATLWYLADLAGASESLGYRPAGVHRPEPAFDLSEM